MDIVLTTDRLQLHHWRDEDRAPIAAMHADPEVMRFIPPVLTLEKSDALFDLLVERQQEGGMNFWAASLRDGPLVGMVGIKPLDYLTPEVEICVEVGWRLAREHWGKGYATEAAKACLAHGFDRYDLDEIVAITAVKNLRSRRVMDRLGMVRDHDADFLHPRFEDGHELKPHVLYRARRR